MNMQIHILRDMSRWYRISVRCRTLPPSVITDWMIFWSLLVSIHVMYVHTVLTEKNKTVPQTSRCISFSDSL